MEADSQDMSIDREIPPVQTRIYGTAHLEIRLASKPISNQYFYIIKEESALWSQFSSE